MAGRGKGFFFSLTRFNLLHSISIRHASCSIPYCSQLIAGELIVISRCLRGYLVRRVSRWWFCFVRYHAG